MLGCPNVLMNGMLITTVFNEALALTSPNEIPVYVPINPSSTAVTVTLVGEPVRPVQVATFAEGAVDLAGPVMVQDLNAVNKTLPV